MKVLIRYYCKDFQICTKHCFIGYPWDCPRLWSWRRRRAISEAVYQQKKATGYYVQLHRCLFQIIGSSRDTIIVCLLEELNIPRVFLAKNGTLSSKHTDIIIGHWRHCFVQDSVVQHILLDRVDGGNLLATDVKTSLNIDSNVGRDNLRFIFA